jgi:hypothetical protein
MKITDYNTDLMLVALIQCMSDEDVIRFKVRLRRNDGHRFTLSPETHKQLETVLNAEMARRHFVERHGG